MLKPDGSANFGLEAEGDARLSDWMEAHLSLATWVSPDGVDLDAIETAVLLRLRPPLNVSKVGEPRDRLREARRRMSDVARSWRPGT